MIVMESIARSTRLKKHLLITSSLILDLDSQKFLLRYFIWTINVVLVQESFCHVHFWWRLESLLFLRAPGPLGVG